MSSGKAEFSIASCGFSHTRQSFPVAGQPPAGLHDFAVDRATLWEGVDVVEEWRCTLEQESLGGS